MYTIANLNEPPATDYIFIYISSRSRDIPMTLMATTRYANSYTEISDSLGFQRVRVDLRSGIYRDGSYNFITAARNVLKIQKKHGPMPVRFSTSLTPKFDAEINSQNWR